MRRRQSMSGQELQCSFCHKSQDAVSKLISSSGSDTRAYICDECIAVCNQILADDARQPVMPPPPANRLSPAHPLFPRFLNAAEQWVQRESVGVDPSLELSAMRKLAREMLGS